MLCEISQSQMFWYMRVCTLTCTNLERRALEGGCWRRAWYLLSKVTKQRWATSEALQLTLHDELSVQIVLDLSREADVADLARDPDAVGTGPRVRVLEFGTGGEIWRHPKTKYESAFITACRSGYTKTVHLLLESGLVNPSTNDDDALGWAVLEGHAGIVKLLIADKRVDPMRVYPNSPDYEVSDSFLTMAARRGHLAVVLVLLEDGRIDPADNDSECLHAASDCDHPEVVRVLLKDGRADPTSNGGDMLILASDEGRMETVRALLEDGRVDPTLNNNEALRAAIESGETEIERLLRADPRVAATWTDENR